jgi:hypothetical protein
MVRVTLLLLTEAVVVAAWAGIAAVADAARVSAARAAAVARGLRARRMRTRKGTVDLRRLLMGK